MDTPGIHARSSSLLKKGLGAANEDPLAAVGSLVAPLLSAESLRFRCSLLGCQPRFGLLALASNPFFSKLLVPWVRSSLHIPLSSFRVSSLDAEPVRIHRYVRRSGPLGPPKVSSEITRKGPAKFVRNFGPRGLDANRSLPASDQGCDRDAVETEILE